MTSAQQWHNNFHDASTFVHFVSLGNMKDKFSFSMRKFSKRIKASPPSY